MHVEAAHLAIVKFDQGRPSILTAQKISHPCLLTFPGGILHPNETPLDCALRTTQEGTGLELSPDWLARTGSVTCVGNKNEMIVLVLFHLFLPPNRKVAPLDLLAGHYSWTWSPLDYILSAAFRGNLSHGIPADALARHVLDHNSHTPHQYTPTSTNL